MRRLPFALLCLALAALTPRAAGASDTFRIVFDGNTGGVSSGRMELAFGDLIFSFLEHKGGRILQVDSSLGVLYRHGRYVWTDDGMLSSAIAFVDGGGFEVLRQVQPAPVIVTERAALLQGVDDPDMALLDSIERAMRERPEYGDPARLQGILTRVRNALGQEAWIAQGPDTPTDAALPADPLAWEIRSQETVVVEFDGKRCTLHQLSRMVGEGSRRMVLVKDRLADPTSPAIYVSAGGAVEGRSYVPGQPFSLVRPASWIAYADAGLRFLSPGHAELLGGIEKLAGEASAARVTVLAANLRDARGESVFPGAELVEIGPAAVAFVGVVDPGIGDRLEANVRAQIGFEEPAPAVERALTALRARTGREPDLVVLLAGFDPATLGELVRQVDDVDVVLGDFSAPSAQRQQVTVSPAAPRRSLDVLDRRPLLVVHAGGSVVGELEGRMEDGQLVDLELRTLPVDQLRPADDAILQRTMKARQAIYLDGEPVLVPDLRDLVKEDVNRLQFLMEGQPYRELLESELAAGTLEVERMPLRMTRDLFHNLSCNLLRERSRVDVVILPPLPWALELSGPTRELYAASYLAVPDRLQLLEISGGQLRELLRLTGDSRNERTRRRRATAVRGDLDAEKRAGAPWVCGLDPGHTKVGGRSLGTGEVYRVLTTSALGQYRGVDTALAGGRPRTRFRARDDGFRASPLGSEVTLSSQILRGLRHERALSPEFDAAYRERLSGWLRDRGVEVWPLFFARADNLGLTLTRYLVSGDQDAYANVRESRVTTPASFTFGMRWDGTVGFDARDVVLSSRSQAALSVNTVGDEPPSELEDDLQFSVDAGLKGLSVRAVPVYPFVQVAYDTEFLRADETDDAGAVVGKLPRQKDLRGTGGVTATNLIPTVKSIKAGTFIEYDFSATEGALESGMSLEVAQQVTRRPLTWGNTLKVYGWFPSDGDTDEDLLISVNLRSELGVLILGNLQLKVYADLLGYRGKVDATAKPGLSTILGVELAYSGQVKRRITR